LTIVISNMGQSPTFQPSYFWAVAFLAKQGPTCQVP
jgi:hypothetical protein